MTLRVAHVFLLVSLALFAGCDRLDMYDQPRYEPLEESDFFVDGLSARPLVEGTIPRGGLRDDEPFYTGKEGGKFVSQVPEGAYRTVYARDPRRFASPYDETDGAALRRALLERGRERFDIYCAVCHGRTGDGNGIIVRRGFRRPPSYHTDRLRNAPAGHFYDVISNGFGAMASYANRIDVADRWAILAYIRALQLSQNARLDDVHEDQREDLPPLDEAAAAGGRADSDLQRTLHAVPRAHYGVPDKEYCVPVGVERAVVAQRCAVAAGRPFPAVTLDPEAATCAIQPAQVPREDAP